ncbi:unnamed protein product, partial [Effrenium voratum]
CEHLETRDNSGCEVSQLQSFTAHWFRVREVCNESSFTSDWAVSAPVTTALVRSEAVQNLTAEPLAPGELSLSWQVPPLQSCGFQGYQVQWREQQGAWSSASCGATLCQSSCRLSVPSNRLVEVQVKVSCSPSEADSDWSGLLVETLPVPAAAVQNLIVSNIHAAGGDLSWTPGPMNDCVLSSWHLGYRDLLGSWTSTSCAADVPCSLSGLACDTAYELRVAASCADFRADGPFVTASFTTDPGDVCLKESPAPRSVAAISLGVSSLSVSWEDVEPGKNCSFQQWQVEVRPSNSDTWRLAAGCAGLARAATSCVATGLQSMMAHSFRVREDCGLPADWGYSSPASTEARPAMAPFDVVATPASDSAMTVQWSTPELNDCVFRSFELQWADVGGSWVSSACDGTFCQSSCLAQPLPSNTLLSFRVRTLCDVEALSSSWSNASDSVATLPRIAEVVVVNISASHDTAELTWERPLLNDCLLLGYKARAVVVAGANGQELIGRKRRLPVRALVLGTASSALGTALVKQGLSLAFGAAGVGLALAFWRSGKTLGMLRVITMCICRWFGSCEDFERYVRSEVCNVLTQQLHSAFGPAWCCSGSQCALGIGKAWCLW